MICDTVEKMTMGITPSVRAMIPGWLTPRDRSAGHKTRFLLWYGQWFLDTTEGTPWIQSVLGKAKSRIPTTSLSVSGSETQGLASITAFNTTVDGTTRRVTFTATVETIYGTTTVTSEA